MTEIRLDVLAIGDAMVDVIASADDSFLQEERLVKGSMQVLDAEGARRLYAQMSQARETSGGSHPLHAFEVARLELRRLRQEGLLLPEPDADETNEDEANDDENRSTVDLRMGSAPLKASTQLERSSVAFSSSLTFRAHSS